jgi:uncharacterized sulfatase
MKIISVVLLYATLFVTNGAVLGAEKNNQRPNIIVMMVDDMGFAGPSIAPYGNPHYKTPGMDRLANEGMLFTDFHASGAICSATRAGLVTGRYQQRAGIEAVIHPHGTHPEHRKGLHPTEVTFAELFKDAGYSTGLVGKWHLGYAAETPAYHPMNHGFDYFMGYVSGNIDYINHWGDHMKHDWWHGRKETKEEGYTTHLVNKYALEFIEQNKDKPFCLYVAHESPHAPVQGPDDPIQRGPGAKKRTTPHAEAMKQMILEMDKGVEQVRAKLIELGLEKNTLFLFFSDNGDAPGTATGSPRFRGHKGSVYEGGTRVPAVAWWPGRIKPGTQANDLSITLDVMPTILSVAGIDPPKERSLDGIDLSPVLFEQKALPARPLFWADLSNSGSRSEALRDGPWKLVVQHPKAKPGTFENEAIELFNLTNDEGEKTNLAARQAERAAAMLKQLKAWYADTQETASPQPGGWILKPLGELLAASIHGSPNVDIAVPNGPYTLQLLLYEGYRSRSADIVIEGKTVRAAYDMFKEQGGNFDHGSVLRHTFTLTDGNIDIEIKGPLHLGGLILSKGKADSTDRVAIVKSPATLDLKDVIKAINFGDTKDLNIGDVKFAAAAVNTTVDGVTNTAGGDVHSGEFGQKLPQIEKAPNPANAKGKPNILFICTDDQAPWALGASGNKQAVTPNMDKLVSEGAYLENAFVTTPVCSPSRAATLTGLYGYEVGVRNWVQFGQYAKGQGINPDSVTTAELLKAAGYSTSLIGKWHLGEEEKHYPTNHGFDYFMGHIQGAFPVINPHFYQNDKRISLKGLTADVLADDVIARMESHINDKQKRPFFIAWHTRAPHTKWLPVAPEDMAPYDKPDFRADVPDYPDLDRERVDQWMKEYLASTRSVDRNLGRVMAALETKGIADNTIVIYTSDHGYHMGHHGIWHKGNGLWILKHTVPRKGNIGANARPNMWENSVRVPTMVRWPGRIKPGARIDADTTNLDWLPTILAMAGIEQPQALGLRGENLVPLLTGKKNDTQRDGVFSFLSFYEDYAYQFLSELRMWRTDRWKLVRDFRNPHLDELYDLKNDPGESRNQINNPKHKAIVDALHAKILHEMRDSNDPALQYLPARVDTGFFNGKDLTGWSASEMKYWSVKDGAIVGHSAVNVPKNEFIWSDVEVKDFYLTVDVKLTPDDRNAGIQFRSKPVDASGQAIGYQADVGAGVWGKLYHEHGRGKLDWNDNAAGAVKPGEWNRYEILAVGHKIWTAINGKLCVAIEDPTGELSGKISFQIHGGAAQTVLYRNPTLIHNPKIALEKQTKEQLLAALPKKAEVPKPASPQPISTPLPHWTRLIMAVDPGSQGEAWAKPTFDHSKWKTMKVPGHFDTVELPGFDGVVWFRKTIELSAEQAKSKVILHLGQIDDMDVTWVNGARVGGYEDPGHHYTVRNYPVPAGLLKTGKNTIAVRVMDHGSPGGIAGTPEQLFLQLDEERISLANRWHFAPGANLATLNKYSQVPALVRPLTRPTSPVPAFADGFAIDSDQTIAVVGSTNALASSQHGYFEALLSAAWPQHKVQMRNIAWQADTVYLQQRPRNFYAAIPPNYGELDGRIRINADIVFFWMGQTESLDGVDHLEEFTTAYSQHLDQIAEYTQRLVLVTPVPFSNPLDLELDIDRRNKSLAVYARAIREIGRERGLPVVDLFAAFLSKEQRKEYSHNGMHLSPDGQWFAAQAFASQLGFSERVTHIKKHQSRGVLLPKAAEELCQAIKQKNDLWFRYWRPTNWAFLYGNRQTQPSSRDHKNPSRRWFPEELKDALTHLNEAEQRIHEAAKAAKGTEE